MPKYVTKRVAYMVVVFFVISFIMYFIYNLIPGDPAAISLESVRDELTADEDEQMYQQARARLGLDDPIFIRYLRWLGVYPSVNGDFNGVFQGNLGYSTMYKQNVVDVIASPLQNTIFLNVFSTILALVITIPLGIFCAVRKNSKFDHAIQVVTIVGYSIPIYIIGLVFIYLFAVKLQIFPVGGVKTSGVTLTGFAALKDKLYYMCLPLIVTTFANLGSMTRYVRAAMIDALSMDYIRTARAKGVAERMVILKHGLRNAILPVVTYLGTLIANLVTGTFNVGRLFAIPGLGKYFVDSITARDYNIIMGVTIFLGVFVVACNLIVDVVYGVIDPRVKLDE